MLVNDYLLSTHHCARVSRFACVTIDSSTQGVNIFFTTPRLSLKYSNLTFDRNLVNTSSICSYASLYSSNLIIFFFTIKWACLDSTIYQLKVFTAKHISCLIIVKYINKQFICPYMVASIISDEVSLNNFMLPTINVCMGLQSIISNLFKISRTYFPWSRKISFNLYHTYRPKK